MRVRRLLLDEHEERLKRGLCPKCQRFSLQKIDVNESHPLPKVKYRIKESFWSCSGPESFNCYFISSIEGDTIFESADGVDVINFDTTPVKYSGAKVIKRRKSGEIVEITPREL